MGDTGIRDTSLAMDLYHKSVKHLPAVERLRLALLILRDISPAELAKAREPRRPAPAVDVGLGDNGIALVDVVRPANSPA